MAISALVDRTLAAIAPLDNAAMASARARQDTLTKPLGSLGRLEELVEYADLVTEMSVVKHPYTSGIKAQPGIEF